MTHPAFAPDRTAVVTGAASGIGLAVAKHVAQLGMRICIVDTDDDGLDKAADQVAALALNGEQSVMAHSTDVSDFDAMSALKNTVYDVFGECALLINNAVTRVGGNLLGSHESWRRAMDVNLWGVINGVQAFVPAMLEQGSPCAVVNCGSKQGITMPPGNSAYNVTKAAVKACTELLQHELRSIEGCQVTAHLLIPGWTTTGAGEHHSGAWFPEQVVNKMVDAIERKEFYILCPDNEVTTAMDHKRILWAAGDIVNNRPPLSRWHPEYAEAFLKFQSGEMGLHELFAGI